MTRKQVITTQNEHEQARATAAERRQALQHYGMLEPAIEQLTASQALDPRLTIISPIDGVVLETSAVPGQTVEALAPIFRLGQMAPFWVEIQVPALRVENFAVGALCLSARSRCGRPRGVDRDGRSSRPRRP